MKNNNFHDKHPFHGCVVNANPVCLKCGAIDKFRQETIHGFVFEKFIYICIGVFSFLALIICVFLFIFFWRYISESSAVAVSVLSFAVFLISCYLYSKVKIIKITCEECGDIQKTHYRYSSSKVGKSSDILIMSEPYDGISDGFNN